MRFTDPEQIMRHAITIAERGRGLVEPNPMVGAVLVSDSLELISEGYHQRYGGPHAEVECLKAASEIPEDATLYVTLEPCAHQGKTPPCTSAILNAKIKNVVIGTPDPAIHERQTGIDLLRAAGVKVSVGVCGEGAARLIRPFAKLQTSGRSYIHAKWAMTLDGKIATREHHSQWISGERSRQEVHRLRGMMDGIAVGSGTAAHDDPLLTARPVGPRTSQRIVFDSKCKLNLESQLLKTIDQAPVMVVCAESADAGRQESLKRLGADVIACPADSSGLPDINAALKELGSRGLTNILVEGGSGLLGAMWDAGEIDEFHVFVAPKIVGGDRALSPLGGTGLAQIPASANVEELTVTPFGDDFYLHGWLAKADAEAKA